jgi:cysteinyl-tRNA synthetase
MTECSKELSGKLMRQYIPPNELFRKYIYLYSKFDNDGIPTHDVSGNELSKSTIKKLNKDWLKQKKLYEESV